MLFMLPLRNESTLMNMLVIGLAAGGVIVVFLVAQAYIPNPASITPSSATIDVGQTVSITLTWSGGSAPYAASLYQSPTSTCTTSSQPAGTIVGGTTSSFTFTKQTNSTVYYCGVVFTPKQSSSLSSTAKVTVNPLLAAPSLVLVPTSIDAGQKVQVNASVSWYGGTAPYTVIVYGGSSTSCSADKIQVATKGNLTSTSASLTFSSVSSTPYYCAVVKDRSFTPHTVTSSVSLFTTAPQLTASISPLIPTIDSGQSIVLTVAASQGTAPYSYQWYKGSGCAKGSAISGATSASYTASPNSTADYSALVTDSSLGTPAASACASETVSVDPAFTGTEVDVYAPPSVVDSGQTVQVTVSWDVSSGTSPYSVQLATSSSPSCLFLTPVGSPVNGLMGPSTTINVSPTSTAYYCATVTDSAYQPEKAASTEGVLLTVNPALQAVGLVLSPPGIDTGQAATVTATFTFSGGTSVYSVTLYASCDSSPTVVGVLSGNNPQTGLSSTTATFTFKAPSSSKYYCAAVTDSATVPSTADSSSVEFMVNQGVSAAITPASPTADLGQSITLTAVASHGTPTYAYAWYAGSPNCTTGLAAGQTSSTYAPSPTAATTYSVKVSDSSPGTPASTACASVKVTVKAALVAPTLTITPPAIDAGQSTAVSANITWSGGTSTYTVQLLSWTASSGSCSSATTSVKLTSGSNPQSGLAGKSVKFTFNSPSSTTYYCAKVTDGATVPQVLSSTAFQFVVSVALGTPTLALSPPAIDSGQSATIVATVSWTGGTPTYTVTLTSGSSSTCSADTTTVGAVSGSNPQTGVATTSATFSFPAPSVSTFYCATVKDGSLVTESTVSASAAFTINPALSVTISPATPAIDSGQAVTITLTAVPVGGASPYFYQWSTGTSCGSPITGQTSYTFSTGTLSSSASYSVKVTDSSPGTPAASSCAHVTVSVNPKLSVTLALSPTSIASGSTTVTATVSWTGGTSPYAVSLYSGYSTVCSTDTTLVASKPNVVGSTTSLTFASPSASTFYCATVTDAAVSPSIVTSLAAAFTVNPSISLSLSPPAIDAGQTATVTATVAWSGGISPYTVTLLSGSSATCASDTTTVGALSGTNPKTGVTGTTATFSFVTPSASTYYCVTVVDSSASQQTTSSPAVQFLVNAALTATVTPSAPAMDSGQSVTITLTANPVGGTSPYFYKWSTGAVCGSFIAGQTASTYSTGTLASNSTFSVWVTDSSVGTPLAGYCAAANVIVNPQLSVHLYLTPTAMDLSQTVTMVAKANWTGGTSPFTITLYSGYSASCASDTTLVTVLSGSNPRANFVGTSVSFSVAAPSTSTYYCLSVVDSSTSAVTLQSVPSLFTVNPALTVSIAPSAPIIDVGQSLVLTATASHGTPAYQYQWYSGSTCTTILTGKTGATYSAGPLTVTTAFSVQARDSSTGSPGAATCASVTIAVSAALTATVTPPTPTVDSGQSITLTAVPAAGTPGYTYQWFAGSGCVAAINGQTGQTYLAGPMSLAVTYSVLVNDSSVGTPTMGACANVTVSVNPAFTGTTVTITPSAATLDSGQPVTLTVTWTGAGTTPYSIVLTTSASASCPNTSPTGFSKTGVIGTSTPFTDYPTSTTYYCATVTDNAVSPESSHTTSAAVITVITPLSVPSLGLSTSAIDNGQSATVQATVSWSGGEALYTVWLYYSSSPNCASPTAVIVLSGSNPVSGLSALTTSFRFSAPGLTTYYCTTVTDSVTSPVTLQSSTLQFLVNPSVSATVSPSAPAIDSGQSVVLTAVPSGGTPSYWYQWYHGLTCNGTISGQTSATYTTPALTGSANYSVLVGDASTGSPASHYCAGVTVTVNAALGAAISPSAPHIDAGQYVSLTASPVGGTGPFIWQWYTGATCSTPMAGQISQVYTTHALSTTTTYSVRVNDSSAAGARSACASVTVTVDLPLTPPAISVSLSTIANDTSTTLSTTSGFGQGTPTYACQWLVESPLGGGYVDLGASFSCSTLSLPTTSTGTLTTTGVWSFELEVTDSSYGSAQTVTSNVVTVNVILV